MDNEKSSENYLSEINIGNEPIGDIDEQLVDIYVEEKFEEKEDTDNQDNTNKINNFENIFIIESTIQICIQNQINNKINDNPSTIIFENFVKENNELKRLNEILEREINLLKSLILINNLNLNTSDSKPCNI
jgi:hypothetical protein